MKKLFTTLALGAFGIAALQAQIFTVTVDGKAVNSGETITSNSIHSFANPGFDSSKPEDMSNMPFFTWELKPVMKINFASAASVVMTVTNNSDTYGLNDCGLTVGISSCQTINPGGSLETKHDAPEGEVEVNVEYNHVFNALDGSYIPLPTSLQLPYKVKLQAENDDATQEFEININIDYNSEPGAVNGIAGDELTFAVENGRVVASDNSAVEVYTFSGVRVANENLNGLYIVRAAGKTAKVAVK